LLGNLFELEHSGQKTSGYRRAAAAAPPVGNQLLSLAPGAHGSAAAWPTKVDVSTQLNACEGETGA
jgi:hypothetical protein